MGLEVLVAMEGGPVVEVARGLGRIVVQVALTMLLVVGRATAGLACVQGVLVFVLAASREQPNLEVLGLLMAVGGWVAWRLLGRVRRRWEERGMTLTTGRWHQATRDTGLL